MTQTPSLKNIGLYLSGPMSGHPDLNAPLFNEIEGMLRHRGFEKIYNPAQHDDASLSYKTLLLNDLNWIGKHADFLVMLPDWKHSKGATVERKFAVACEIPIVDLDRRSLPEVLSALKDLKDLAEAKVSGE